MGVEEPLRMKEPTWKVFLFLFFIICTVLMQNWQSGTSSRVGLGLQWAGPKSGRVKIDSVFSGQNFNSPTRPKNRSSRSGQIAF